MALQQSNINPWSALEAELDAWHASGNVATFWWRDDDAVAPGPKLDRLLELTTASGLLLAVIPARAHDSLASRLAQAAHVQVGQHGYAHTNHAPRGQRLGAWELGLHRAESAVLAELDTGRERLQDLFGQAFIPVVIPPWNHIDSALLVPLAARGYCGVSLFGPHDRTDARPAFIVANAHCDPINWKKGPRFTGESKALNQLIEHLAARRTGAADADEATGILTHHIDMDEASWAFCVRVEQLLSQHPAARWCSPRALFGVAA